MVGIFNLPDVTFPGLYHKPHTDYTSDYNARVRISGLVIMGERG